MAKAARRHKLVRMSAEADLRAGTVRSGQLPMRVRPASPISDDELEELARLNRDLRIERNAEGEIIIMPPTGGNSGRRNFSLIAAFGVWEKQDGTGVAFDSSTGFFLPNGAERSPDLAWIKAARWEALTPEQRERFVPLCPDFVVEIRSPSDSLAELSAKLEEYVANGASLGWLIDPYERRIHVHRPGRVVECLAEPTEISGDPVLPGFVLATKALW
jgi:Uma2 family endonuclease